MAKPMTPSNPALSDSVSRLSPKRSLNRRSFLSRVGASAPATVAGACVTILKAWFDESFVIPDPIVSSEDGIELIPYTGPDAGSLTVGGELNKVAANIAMGRNFAGIHWRTDYSESVKLGEQVALGILEEQKETYNEHHSFTLTTFDGTTIKI
jgi:hypothetical protein